MPIAIVNFKELRRAMSVTPAELVQITRDGLVYDHVRYRWNRKAVGDMLDAGDHRLPAGLRTPGTAMVMLSIRVWHDDIDMIEVFDSETGTYHEMWSTEPEYTSGLSRWEHRQYLEMIKAGKGGASSDVDRLRIKGMSLCQQDELMPELSFRDRAVGAALVEAEGYRRNSGARATRPGYAEVPELGATMTPGGQNREDLPTTPTQSGAKPKGKRRTGRTGKAIPNEHQAPPRDEDYGYSSLARQQSRTDEAVDPSGDALAEDRATRLARWARLGAPHAPDADSGTVEDGGVSQGASASADYHLREDDQPANNGIGESVTYDHDEDEEE